MFRGSRQRRGPGLGLMLLVMQLLNVGLDNIPPVTLATIFGNTAVFLGLFDLKYPSIGQVCVSVVNVWYRKDWQRLLLAAFFHAHEWHLYYNMVSFLWKGISLEKRLGSLYFAYLIAVFSVLVNCTLLLLDTAAANIYENDHYLSTCAVGFSGVIFALKVVTTYYLPPGIQYVMGIPVPSRIACWVELGVIQLLVPNASFTGHLAGILVGLAYMKGPLKYIMDSIISPADARRFTPTSRASGWRQFRGQGSNQGQGYNLGGSGESYNSNLYTGGLTEEEQYRRAMEESMADSIQVVPVTHYTDDGAEEEDHVTTGQSADDGNEEDSTEISSSPRNAKQGGSSFEKTTDGNPHDMNLTRNDLHTKYDENDYDKIQELLSLECGKVLDALSKSQLEQCEVSEEEDEATEEAKTSRITSTNSYEDASSGKTPTSTSHLASKEGTFLMSRMKKPLPARIQEPEKKKRNNGLSSKPDPPLLCEIHVSKGKEHSVTAVDSEKANLETVSTRLPKENGIPVLASNNSTERQNGSPRPSSTPQASVLTGRLLSPDELRQRRLAKLEKDQSSQPRSQTSQQSKAGVSRLPVKRKT